MTEPHTEKRHPDMGRPVRLRPLRVDDDSVDVERLNRERSGYSRRLVDLAPGAVLQHEESFWQEAIVFLTRGELEIECSAGEHHRFRVGDILTFAKLPIARVHNSGPRSARLLAISKVTSPKANGPGGNHD